MSKEAVEQFERGTEAVNRRDWETMIDGLDPDVEWYPALLTELAGAKTVYRGHDGVREWIRTLEEVMTEVHLEYSEIRDLGDRVLAIGEISTRGEASGATTKSPVAYLVDYENAKATTVRSFLDHQAAFEAAGLT